MDNSGESRRAFTASGWRKFQMRQRAAGAGGHIAPGAEAQAQDEPQSTAPLLDEGMSESTG